MADSEIAGLTEDTTPDATDNVYAQDAAGAVDKRVPLSALPVSTATTAAIAAEATLARNGDNITSGTVADARIASTIARDSEVTSAVAAAVSDTAYAGTWNAVTTIAPSKNAVYDQMELLVPKSLYDANTILIATTDNTPVAMPVAASRIVGRKASGDIDDMTTAELAALFGTPDGTKFLKDDGTLATPAGGGGGGTVAPPFIPRVTGRYYSSQVTSNATSDSTNPVTTGNLYSSPFVTGAAVTLDRIGVDVLSPASAGNRARLGIYNDSAGVPGSLLLDAGTVLTDSTGGKTITISQALSASTLYWLVVIVEANCSLRGSPAATVPWNGVTAITDNATSAGGYSSASWAALPGSYGTFNLWTVTGMVRVRIA